MVNDEFLFSLLNIRIKKTKLWIKTNISKTMGTIKRKGKVGGPKSIFSCEFKISHEKSLFILYFDHLLFNFIFHGQILTN